MNWIRSATLQIGPFKHALDGLDFSFEVPFEDSEELSTATVTVTNLSAKTRNAIKYGLPVIINAGYEGDIGIIFYGAATSLSHRHEGTEWITKVVALEVANDWMKKEVNKTYKRSIKAEEMVRDLVNIFGIEVGMLDLAVNKEYPRGRVCHGKVKNVLQEIVVGDCQSRMLVRNGRLYINDPTDGINKGYLLSPATGLMRSDEDIETVSFTDTPQQDEKDTKIRRCTLNYHLGASDHVKIQSKTLNGVYQIVRGKHVGSQSKDWYTEIEVKAV